VIADSNALDVCFADSIVPIIDLSATISTNAINACFWNFQYVEVCNYGTIPATDVEVIVEIPIQEMKLFRLKLLIRREDRFFQRSEKEFQRLT